MPSASDTGSFFDRGMNACAYYVYAAVANWALKSEYGAVGQPGKCLKCCGADDRRAEPIKFW
jgi:hypothetical protein